jgi:hypothetical protein
LAELNDVEREIYDFFSRDDNVDKLVTFLKTFFASSLTRNQNKLERWVKRLAYFPSVCVNTSVFGKKYPHVDVFTFYLIS